MLSSWILTAALACAPFRVAPQEPGPTPSALVIRIAEALETVDRRGVPQWIELDKNGPAMDATPPPPPASSSAQLSSMTRNVRCRRRLIRAAKRRIL